ncbi:hypothetical protein Ddc_14991 [Ditylenchus destructor]|nr:hypothetical protein Ddc_14991 [Ditylenchus destructor]
MPGLKLIVALMAVGFCSAKYVGFQGIEARFGEIFAQGNEGGACQMCEDVVKAYDELLPGSLPPGTAEFLAEGQKEVCDNLPPTVPPECVEFCKAINGKELDFAKAYVKYRDHEKKGEPCLKLSIAIVVFIAVGFCSAKSVGFQGIEARLGEIFAHGNGGGACQVCEIIVVSLDKQFPGRLPPGAAESLAKGLQVACANLPDPPPEFVEFCKALDGKALDFTKAYVKYHDHGKTGEPCKEVGIC